MRDRLIELVQSVPYGNGTLGDYFNRSYIDNCIVEHLLANGVIVPPCKVGDILYAISEDRIAECVCDEVSICQTITVSANFECDYDCEGCPFNSWKQDFPSGEYSCNGEYGTYFFSLDDFGKTVFLTKEEAEVKLKGGERDV